MALADQALYAGMLREIDYMIQQAKPIKAELPDGTVQIGRLVHVKDMLSEETYWIKIGSFWNETEGKGTPEDPTTCSYLSPISRVLMGKKVGNVADCHIGKLKKHLKIIEIC